MTQEQWAHSLPLNVLPAEMVAAEGFEPSPTGLCDPRSTAELHRIKRIKDDG